MAIVRKKISPKVSKKAASAKPSNKGAPKTTKPVKKKTPKTVPKPKPNKKAAPAAKKKVAKKVIAKKPTKAQKKVAQPKKVAKPKKKAPAKKKAPPRKKSPKKAPAPKKHSPPSIWVPSLATQVGDMNRLFNEAKRVARQHSMYHWMANPVAGGPSQSFDLFSKGLTYCGYSEVADLLRHAGHFLMGFHGTRSVQKIAAIFDEGFDPSFRHAQEKGGGEYFDISDGQLAGNYGTSTGCVIVTLIITHDRWGSPLREFSTHNWGDTGTVVGVVDNPTEHSYCMPCAIASKRELTFDVQQKVYDEFKSNFTRMGLAKPEALKVDTRSLYFKDYDGGWTRQCDLIQQEARNAAARGDTEFTVYNYTIVDHEGIRKTFNYEYDLSAMTQKNLDSGTVRQMCRR